MFGIPFKYWQRIFLFRRDNDFMQQNMRQKRHVIMHLINSTRECIIRECWGELCSTLCHKHIVCRSLFLVELKLIENLVIITYSERGCGSSRGWSTTIIFFFLVSSSYFSSLLAHLWPLISFVKKLISWN